MKTNHETWMQDALVKIRNKMEWVAEKNKYKIPYTTDEDGIYDDSTSDDCLHVEGLYWWTNGFWSGLMWLLYHDTKKDVYLEAARNTEHMLEKCFEGFYLLHHDVGFMWHLTSGANYRITGNEVSGARNFFAATSLASRYNITGDFIRAWNSGTWNGITTEGFSIIDCLMNLQLVSIQE
jgi:unsaturated chondroitin disaccharide hydrolase